MSDRPLHPDVLAALDETSFSQRECALGPAATIGTLWQRAVDDDGGDAWDALREALVVQGEDGPRPTEAAFASIPALLAVVDQHEHAAASALELIGHIALSHAVHDVEVPAALRDVWARSLVRARRLFPALLVDAEGRSLRVYLAMLAALHDDEDAALVLLAVLEEDAEHDADDSSHQVRNR